MTVEDKAYRELEGLVGNLHSMTATKIAPLVGSALIVDMLGSEHESERI